MPSPRRRNRNRTSQESRRRPCVTGVVHEAEEISFFIRGRNRFAFADRSRAAARSAKGCRHGQRIQRTGNGAAADRTDWKVARTRLARRRKSRIRSSPDGRRSICHGGCGGCIGSASTRHYRGPRKPFVGGCPKSLRWHSGGLYACCRSGWIGTHSVTLASRRRVDRIYQFRTFGRQ